MSEPQLPDLVPCQYCGELPIFEPKALCLADSEYCTPDRVFHHCHKQKTDIIVQVGDQAWMPIAAWNSSPGDPYE